MRGEAEGGGVEAWGTMFEGSPSDSGQGTTEWWQLERRRGEAKGSGVKAVEWRDWWRH